MGHSILDFGFWIMELSSPLNIGSVRPFEFLVKTGKETEIQQRKVVRYQPLQQLITTH